MNRNVPAVPRGDRVHQELVKPEKYLEVGFTPDMREVIIQMPIDGEQWLTFSPQQARNLARILLRKADECVP
jgi:hypothetical protein